MNELPDSWVGNTVVQFPFAVNLVVYILLWAVALVVLYFIWQRAKAAGFAQRWTTQDILVVAIMGVLLEVYDNLIGDQFITPIIKLIPFGHLFALNDLPYMFLLMVGVALIRKPGVATAMVFLNFLLMQLLYGGDKSSVLWWPYGIYQGLLVDLYFVLRGGRVFARNDVAAIWDGFVMGAVRAVPAVTISTAILSPFLTGETTTLGYIFFYSLFNLLGNGIAAAISAPLAIRVARSVNPTVGQDAPLVEPPREVAPQQS